MRDGPYRKLSAREESVATLMARGHTYAGIAKRLRISPKYVELIVGRIADLLPDAEADDIPAHHRVMIWALHRRWLETHKAAA